MPDFETSIKPEAAARQILELQSFDSFLRHRVRGVTWMIWGFVLAGIFLSFDLSARVWGRNEGEWPLWAYMVWLPWAAGGFVATLELWRSTRLLGGLSMGRVAKRSAAAVGILLGAIYVGFTLTHFILGGLDKHASNPAIVVLASLALALLVWGILVRSRFGRQESWALIVAGAVLLLGDVAAVVLTRGLAADAQQNLFGWFAPLLSGIAFFLAGWIAMARQ